MSLIGEARKSRGGKDKGKAKTPDAPPKAPVQDTNTLPSLESQVNAAKESADKLKNELAAAVDAAKTEAKDQIDLLGPQIDRLNAIADINDTAAKIEVDSAVAEINRVVTAIKTILEKHKTGAARGPEPAKPAEPVPPVAPDAAATTGAPATPGTSAGTEKRAAEMIDSANLDKLKTKFKDDFLQTGKMFDGKNYVFAFKFDGKTNQTAAQVEEYLKTITAETKATSVLDVNFIGAKAADIFKNWWTVKEAELRTAEKNLADVYFESKFEYDPATKKFKEKGGSTTLITAPETKEKIEEMYNKGKITPDAAAHKDLLPVEVGTTYFKAWAAEKVATATAAEAATTAAAEATRVKTELEKTKETELFAFFDEEIKKGSFKFDAAGIPFFTHENKDIVTDTPGFLALFKKVGGTPDKFSHWPNLADHQTKVDKWFTEKKFVANLAEAKTKGYTEVKFDGTNVVPTSEGQKGLETQKRAISPEEFINLMGQENLKEMMKMFFTEGDDAKIKAMLGNFFDKLSPAEITRLEALVKPKGFASFDEFKNEWKAKYVEQIFGGLKNFTHEWEQRVVSSDSGFSLFKSSLSTLNARGTRTQRFLRFAGNMIPAALAGAGGGAAAGFVTLWAVAAGTTILGVAAPLVAGAAGAGFLAKMAARFMRRGEKKELEEQRGKNEQLFKTEFNKKMEKLVDKEGDMLVASAMSATLQMDLPKFSEVKAAPSGETPADKTVRVEKEKKDKLNKAELELKTAETITKEAKRRLDTADAELSGLPSTATEKEKKNAEKKVKEAKERLAQAEAQQVIASMRLDNERARQNTPVNTPDAVQKASFWTEAMEHVKKTGATRGLWEGDKSNWKEAAGYLLEGFGGAATAVAIVSAGGGMLAKAGVRGGIGLVSGFVGKYAREITMEMGNPTKKLDEYLAEEQKKTDAEVKARRAAGESEEDITKFKNKRDEQIKLAREQLEGILPKKTTKWGKAKSALKAGLVQGGMAVGLGAAFDAGKDLYHDVTDLQKHIEGLKTEPEPGFKEQLHHKVELEKAAEAAATAKAEALAKATATAAEAPPVPQVEHVSVADLKPEQVHAMLEKSLGFDPVVEAPGMNGSVTHEGFIHVIKRALEHRPDIISQRAHASVEQGGIPALQKILDAHGGKIAKFDDLTPAEMNRVTNLLYTHDISKVDVRVSVGGKVVCLPDEKGHFIPGTLDGSDVKKYLYTEKNVAVGGGVVNDKDFAQAVKGVIKGNHESLNKVIDQKLLAKFKSDAGSAAPYDKEIAALERQARVIKGWGVTRDECLDKLAHLKKGTDEWDYYAEKLTEAQIHLREIADNLNPYGTGHEATDNSVLGALNQDALKNGFFNDVLTSLHESKAGKDFATSVTDISKPISFITKHEAFHGDLSNSAKFSGGSDTARVADMLKAAGHKVDVGKGTVEIPADKAVGGGGAGVKTGEMGPPKVAAAPAAAASEAAPVDEQVSRVSEPKQAATAGAGAENANASFSPADLASQQAQIDATKIHDMFTDAYKEWSGRFTDPENGIGNRLNFAGPKIEGLSPELTKSLTSSSNSYVGDIGKKLSSVLHQFDSDSVPAAVSGLPNVDKHAIEGFLNQQLEKQLGHDSASLVSDIGNDGNRMYITEDGNSLGIIGSDHEISILSNPDVHFEKLADGTAEARIGDKIVPLDYKFDPQDGHTIVTFGGS